MTLGTTLFLGFIILQRLSELFIAKRNTTRLLARGAHEVGAAHYPVIVAMHSAWIVCLVVFGWDNPVQTGWLAIFIVLQGFRFWILTTLGSRWTTRVIVIDEPLVTRGPFRIMNHPNYALVVAEIIAAPMVLGLVWVAVLFSLLNAAVLFYRIRVEDTALRG